MTGGDWIIAISIGLIAIGFIVLVIFLARMLISLSNTIKTTNEICQDLESKLHSFDPYLRVVEDLGKCVENKTGCSVKNLSEEMEFSSSSQRRQKAADIVNTSMEVAEWTLLGLGLWKKIKDRR